MSRAGVGGGEKPVCSITKRYHHLLGERKKEKQRGESARGKKGRKKPISRGKEGENEEEGSTLYLSKERKRADSGCRGQDEVRPKNILLVKGEKGKPLSVFERQQTSIK